jgi:hypothetical protein
MAKRDNGTKRAYGGITASGATTGGAMNAPKKNPAAATARGTNKGRSGGVVDAPGKKHRKPIPSDPNANMVHSQAAKMRMAKTMVKTNRRRGRG